MNILEFRLRQPDGSTRIVRITKEALAYFGSIEAYLKATGIKNISNKSN